DGMLIGFGKESIEFFQQTGSSTLPITPLQNLVIEEGIKSTGCATAIGETFAAISSRNTVIFSPQAEVISNKGLQEKIAASATHRLFTFILDGDEMLALRLDTETHCWSRRTGQWCEFQTLGQTNWAPQCYADGVFGSAIDGKTLEWGTNYTDVLATSTTLERRFRGGFPLNSGALTVDNVQLRTNPGQTPYLVAPYDDPTIEMRISRDGAQTWGNWRPTSLGEQGEYRQKVQWRGCGQAAQPGFVAEWRVTDPVGFRISAVLINEQYGGR
ncbi:MAG: packaged DNA stabilization protein gp10, partial [Gallionella sp.]|nr:packaged DNA stabilization protein gp10 [Gallionella sp.]